MFWVANCDQQTPTSSAYTGLGDSVSVHYCRGAINKTRNTLLQIYQGFARLPATPFPMAPPPHQRPISQPLHHFHSAQSLRPAATPSGRPRRSSSIPSLAVANSIVPSLPNNLPPSQIRSSRTWTTSSGDLGFLSDADEVEDRTIFAQEYNRLAKNVGCLYGFFFFF